MGGKVKPTMVALGRNGKNEYRDNLRFVSFALNKTQSSAKGLLFTNNAPDAGIPFVEKYRELTFARTGFVSTMDYRLSAGDLNEKGFVFSQEHILKRLGLPVVLKRGHLMLNQDYIVCEKGQPLKPTQAKLLKLLNEPMANFAVRVYGYWTNETYYDIVADVGDEVKGSISMDEKSDMSGVDEKEEQDIEGTLNELHSKAVQGDNDDKAAVHGMLDDFMDDDSSDE